MRQFLRFVAIVLLVLIGFGTGICGLLGLGATFTDLFGSRGHDADQLLILGLSALCVLATVGCFFGIRALVRSLRAAAQRDSR